MKRILAIACLLLIIFSINTSLLHAKQHNQETAKKEVSIPLYKDPGAVTTQNESLAQKSLSFVWNLIKYVFILILAVALAYFGVHGATKLAMLRGVTPLGSGTIKLLETTYLGQNKALHLVEIADEVFLISSSQNNIQLMTKLEDRDKIVELVSKKVEQTQSIQQPFVNVLDKFMEKYKTQADKPRGGLQTSFESTLKALKSNLAVIKSKNETERTDIDDEKGT